MRSFKIAAAHEADVLHPKIVGHDEDDIRLWLFFASKSDCGHRKGEGQDDFYHGRGYMAFGGMLRENLFTRERDDFLQQLATGGTYFSWLLFFSEGLLRWKEGVGEEDASGEGDE